MPIWLLFPVGGALVGFGFAWWRHRRYLRPGQLHEAAHAGRVDALRAHLARFTREIDARERDGYTPLMAAVLGKQLEAARLLLEAGADPNLVAPERSTALLMAAGTGPLEMVRLLLAHGARPNRVDDAGVSPLHYAAARGDLPMVRALLEAGAHPDLKDALAGTPLDVARAGGHDAVAEALVAAGGRPKEEVRMADVLAELAPDDRAAFDLPRAWGLALADPRLVAAKQAARDRLAELRGALSRGVYVRVKVPIQDEGAAEAIWAEVVEHGQDALQVVLLAEPLRVAMPEQPMAVPFDELADWEFEEPEGCLHGGFTKRVTYDALRDEFGYLPPDIEEEMAMYADEPA